MDNNKEKLDVPQFQFAYVKKVEGCEQWPHWEQKKWRLQVANFKSNENDKPIWEDVPNAYFIEDRDGNQKQVSLEEFNKDLKHPVTES
jgi:hypothetical protein